MGQSKSGAVESNKARVVLGVLPHSHKKSIKIIASIIAAILIVAAVSILVRHHHRAVTAQATQPANTVEQQLMAEAVPQLDPSHVAQLGAVIQKIQAIKSYQTNINYDYVNLIYYLNTSNYSQASDYYTEYTNLDEDEQLDSVIAPHAEKLAVLDGQLTAIEPSGSTKSTVQTQPLVEAP